MEVRANKTDVISERMVRSHVHMLEPYTKTLRDIVSEETYSLPESVLKIPFDELRVKKVGEIANRFKKIKELLLVGIGGSDMGTLAIYNALNDTNSNKEAGPRLFTLGTIDPKHMRKVQEIIMGTESSDDVALVVISKSGSTAETIANANEIFSVLRKKFGDKKAAEQTLIITDEQSSLLQKATKYNIEVATFPKPIGGRFSVFTEVGLIPLAILGFDIEALCEGARRGIRASITEERPSIGAVLAGHLFEAYLEGARIHELFFWNPELETLGKWYRQLLAESIGKEREDGTRIGLTPTVAIGSTDLHSVGQLIFGGRNDRFTSLISAPTAWKSDYRYEEDTLFTLPMLEGKTPENLMQAIYGGVKKTYEHDQLPFVEIEFSELNEQEIGAFMSLHMTVIMYLAKLFDVNAFDQPAVESYKQEVRNLLHNT